MPRKRSSPTPSDAADIAAQAATKPLETAPTGHRWTFLTNHAHVLILLSRESPMVLREVAMRIGITERAVQRIISDLEEGGFIERAKIGRSNHYRISAHLPLRHPIEAHRSIGDLLALMSL